MKMYIISTVHYEYDDQYSFGGDSISANILCFIDEKLAEEKMNELEFDEFYNGFLSNNYSFEQPFDKFTEEELEIINSVLPNFISNSNYDEFDSFEDDYDSLDDNEKKVVNILFKKFNHSFYCLSEVEVADTFA